MLKPTVLIGLPRLKPPYSIPYHSLRNQYQCFRVAETRAQVTRMMCRHCDTLANQWLDGLAETVRLTLTCCHSDVAGARIRGRFTMVLHVDLSSLRHHIRRPAVTLIFDLWPLESNQVISRGYRIFHVSIIKSVQAFHGLS